MVVSVTVWASNGVLADSEALLTVLLVHVRLLTLFARLVVVVFCVSSTTTVASDRAVGVSFVSEFLATGALDEVDLLDPFGAEAGSVEEKGAASEFLKMGFVWVRDTEADVAVGCVGNAISVGPGRSFYEYGISKDGVGFTDFIFQFHVGDLDKFAGRCSSVLVCGCVLIGNPFMGGDVLDDNPGPLGGLDEQTFVGSPCKDSKDGVPGLLNLRVDGVVGKEDSEVHCGGPFGRVSLDMELSAGMVDLTDDGLDGHCCSREGFLVLVEFDHVAFAIVAGVFCRLFQHWGHKPRGGDIIVL